MGTKQSRRRILVIALSVCLLLLLLPFITLNAFKLNILDPTTPGQTLVFISLSVLAFLLFVTVLVALRAQFHEALCGPTFARAGDAAADPHAVGRGADLDGARWSSCSRSAICC